MKFTIPFLVLLSLSTLCVPQGKTIDSLRRAFSNEKTDSIRANILWQMANTYTQNKPDSELFLAQRALILSRKIKYVTGEMKSLKLMAEAYQYLGNFPLALRYYLQRLELDEKNPNNEREVVTLFSIANLYQSEGDYRQALFYEKKVQTLIDQHKIEVYRWYSYMGFGETYEKMNDIPNAISYDEKAYKLALKANNADWMGMCLNNTGNAYVKDGNYTAALDFYRKGIPYLKTNNNTSFLCESYLGVSTILFKSGELDSAINYAKRSLKLAISRGFSEKYLNSCQLLTKIYMARLMADSALVYQGKTLLIKDSIYSLEKERQIANLTISEQIRQKERAQEKLQEDYERSYKLKLLLVGLLIPFSFLVSLILSKRKLHPRLIEFSGIVSLLMLFEYLTILLHPIVVTWTNHSPFLEILIFVSIASVLTPSHHRLEHWMLHKLTAHNHHSIATPVIAAAEKATILNSPGEEEKVPDTDNTN